MPCRIRPMGMDSLGLLKPLWEQLNAVHFTESGHFKEYYHSLRFEKRCEKFTALKPDDVHILGVFPEGKKKPVGYCISTVINKVGELDSLFVESDWRKAGYGAALVEQSIAWMKNKGCIRIIISVAGGHESVFGFYERFGFYPRYTTLELKE